MAVDPSTLDAMPFLRRLAADARAELAAIATLEEHSAGAVLFREGDAPGAVFLVLEGRVTLTMRVGQSEASVLSLGVDELVGWSSLLARRRVATALISQRSRLLRIEASPLLELCERDARVGYAVMAQAFEDVSDRLVDTRMQLLDLYGKGASR
jgi:CRP/FNR family cyclic AMP-dependent transcriptional regulator